MKELLLPAEEFYWGVLDTAGARVVRREQLDYAFEPLIPEPIDEVCAAYRRLGANRYLGCALPRRKLEEARDSGALSLAPDALPDFIDEPVDARTLNLLTGRYAPPAVVRVDKAAIRRLAILAALGLFLVAYGLHRRSVAALVRGGSIRAATDALASRVLPAASSPLPVDLRLEAELRQLRRTRERPRLEPMPDASRPLGQILAAWPDDVPAQTEELTVTAETIRLRARVDGNASAQILADALADVPGWEPSQPTIRTIGEQVRVDLELRRRRDP